MAGADNFLQYQGEYVPTTEIWQVISELSSSNPGSDQFKELIVRLALIVNRINLAVNTKETGIYSNLEEFVTTSTYFPNPALNSGTSQFPDYRNVYRTVINFGTLPNTTTKSVAHGIPCTSATSFTRIYGAATHPSTSYIPLPYSSATAAADDLEVYADTSNVYVATGANYSSYTISYIVLEYLQN